jgi:hypothetical protein
MTKGKNPKGDAERIAALCGGNAEALDFLCLWGRYCHEIDDIVDGERTGKQEIIGTFALAVRVYSHPFLFAEPGGATGGGGDGG